MSYQAIKEKAQSSQPSCFSTYTSGHLNGSSRSTHRSPILNDITKISSWTVSQTLQPDLRLAPDKL
jgi:hypothetical protein